MVRAFVLSVSVLIGLALGAPAETLTYRLTPRPDKGSIEVELRWKTAGRDVSRVCVSQKWGTVRNVPALIRDLQIEGARSVSREGACWVVRHRAGTELRFTYEVEPGRREFDWDVTHHPITTDTFFHGVGNAFLLSPGIGGSMPAEYEVLLRWELPRGWRAVCSWAPGKNVGARLSAADVRHSVYLAGKLLIRTRDLPEAGRADGGDAEFRSGWTWMRSLACRRRSLRVRWSSCASGCFRRSW